MLPYSQQQRTQHTIINSSRSSGQTAMCCCLQPAEGPLLLQQQLWQLLIGVQAYPGLLLLSNCRCCC
jgi:hypothetical protein